MELVITIKAEPEEMDTALQAVSKFFASNVDDVNTKVCDIKKQKRSEYDKKRYQEKKKTHVELSGIDVKSCENDVENSEITVESTKEKKEEKESVSPLSSPLSFPPNTPFSYPPIIPPSKEKGERKETFLDVAVADVVKTQPETKLAKIEKSSEKTVQNVSKSTLKTQKTANEKPKLTPEDDAYWNVYGRKKELAIAFYKATGLYPTSGEFGRWQQDLDGFIEAGVTVDYMVEAVRKIDAEKRIEYKAPGSVLATARYLMVQNNRAGKSSVGANMTPDEIMANGHLFSSAAEMLRALAESESRTNDSEVIDL